MKSFCWGKFFEYTSRSTKLQDDSRGGWRRLAQCGGDMLVNKHLIFYLYLFIISYVLMFVIFTIHNYVQNIEWMDTVKIRSKFLWKFLLLYKRKYILSCINNNNCNKNLKSNNLSHK